MKNKYKTITAVLGVLIGIFLILVSYFAIPMPHIIRRKLFLIAAILGLAFFVLGVVLIILTFTKKVKGKLKWFLLMAGIPSAAVLPSVILHNLAYGLFIHLFGEGYWERIGMGDEPFFFILALIVCPIVFLAGSAGSVVLLARKR